MHTKHLEKLVSRYPVLQKVQESINLTFNIIKKSYESGGTLFLCGNGGSAADSEHIAGELLKSFLLPRKIDDSKFINNIKNKFNEDSEHILNKLQKGLKTISLTSHPALITAYSNDVDAEYIYAQQLYVLSKPGDILLGISTSGNAQNVYRAMQVASAAGVKTILLSGKTGGKCSEIADHSIIVPCYETYEIQELHLPIYHTLCIMLEEYFMDKNVDLKGAVKHLAIIMDGNGRWAKKRELPRTEGHREGAKTVRRVLNLMEKYGIEYLTLYAFSTENWKRPKTEVTALMGLLKEFLELNRSTLMEKDVKLKVIGRINDIPLLPRKFYSQ